MFGNPAEFEFSQQFPQLFFVWFLAYELLLIQLSFLLGEGRCSSGRKSPKNRLVSDMPSLRVKVGLLYFTNGAIRELLPPKK